MFIKIDMTSDTPIYEQLKQNIIQGIATNELRHTQELPSVRQLAADLSVNMHTVAKAYTQLKDSGFISVHRNKGAVINAPDMYAATDKYFEALQEKLFEKVAEAICRGTLKEQWLKLCSDAYDMLHEKKEIKK